MPADEQAEAPRHPGGRPTKYDPAYCALVVEDMGKGYSLGAFAGLIGVARSTINEWIDNYPEFSEAVSRGKAVRLRDWEQAAMNIRSGNGGAGASTITIFGLKNMSDGDWDDVQRQEFSGPGGGPIPLQKIERVIVDPKGKEEAAS